MDYASLGVREYRNTRSNPAWPSGIHLDNLVSSAQSKGLGCSANPKTAAHNHLFQLHIFLCFLSPIRSLSRLRVGRRYRAADKSCDGGDMRRRRVRRQLTSRRIRMPYLAQHRSKINRRKRFLSLYLAGLSNQRNKGANLPTRSKSTSK